MVKKTETIAKIVKIGNSHGVIIDKKTLDYMGLKVDDIIKLIIVKEDDTNT